MPAPIVLFVYNRLDHLIQTIESLRCNHLASKSSLYIFSDGAKNTLDDANKVFQVREYIKTITGFSQVTIYLGEFNKGCGDSVITGVSLIFANYSRVIVLEDDLILAPNFLDFMNASLDFYEDKNIWGITGWAIDLDFEPKDTSDVYYSQRGECWGWATWKDRWEKTDWEMKDYRFFYRLGTHEFSFGEYGGDDLCRLAALQISGKIDSWAIRWCYSQYKKKMLTVYPKVSKVINIGLYGTHQNGGLGYPVTLDVSNKTSFDFGGDICINFNINKQLMQYYTFSYRAKNKIKRIFQNHYNRFSGLFSYLMY